MPEKKYQRGSSREVPKKKYQGSTREKSRGNQGEIKGKSRGNQGEINAAADRQAVNP